MNTLKFIKELTSIIIITTVGTILFSYVKFIVFENNIPPSLLSLWNRWDTYHYLDIAQNGYTNVSEGRFFIVFFPFYPFMVKLFALIFRNYMLSAVIVSNIAYAFAAFYLYKLILLDYPEEIALRAFCISP